MTNISGKDFFRLLYQLTTERYENYNTHYHISGASPSFLTGGNKKMAKFAKKMMTLTLGLENMHQLNEFDLICMCFMKYRYYFLKKCIIQQLNAKTNLRYYSFSFSPIEVL